MEKGKKHKEYKNAFIQKLKENKLYFVSFIITVCFVGYGLLYVLQNSDGMVSKQNKQKLLITERIKKELKANNGYYTHAITLNEKVNIGTCTVDSYSYVYEVKDGSFTKYFYNSCLGIIKLEKKENLVVNDYSFEDNGITFNKDTSITSLVENTNSSVSIYFYDENIVLLSDDDLILIKNNKVDYVSSKENKSSGGNLSQRYYKSNNEDTFNYIVFYNDEEIGCYQEVDRSHSTDKLYEIYQIRYNSLLSKFDEPKVLVERTKGDLCTNYENDIELLKQ